MLSELVHLAAIAPLGLLVIAVLLVPGLLILLPLGARLPAAVALAPPVGLASLSVTSIVLAALGIPWGPATATIGTLFFFAVALLLHRRFQFMRWSQTKPGGLLIAGLTASLVAASLITVVALFRGMGGIDTASQGWDPIFHMNAVEWIQESGRSTPWSISPIYGGVGANYYPVGWHLIASLIPADAVQTANMMTLVIGGVLWPIGLAHLASVVFPDRAGVWLLTPLLAASYVSFPYAQLMRSGQWPNGFGSALVPSVLAILIVLLRLIFKPDDASESPEKRFPRLIPVGVASMLALMGATAAHPGALLAVGVAVVPFTLAYWLPWLRTSLRNRLKLGLLSILVGAVLSTGIFVALTQSRLLDGVMNYERAVRAELPDSIPFALFDLPTFPSLQTPSIGEFNLHVGLLAAVGALIGVIRPGHRALAIAWMAFVLLHILAAGPENPFRWLAGFWYKDTQRIAPMIAMTGALLAGWVVSLLTGTAASVLRRALTRGTSASAHLRRYTAAVTAVIVLIMLYAASDNFRAADRIGVTAKNYSVGNGGMGVLADGEQSFIEEAAALLPGDAVVVGDPFNGETYFYTLGQRRVVYTQLGSATSGDEAKEYLRSAFKQIHTDAKVCRAISTLGVTHFYEDTPGVAHASDGLVKWPGFYGTDVSRGFEIVATEGPWTLYEITAC